MTLPNFTGLIALGPTRTERDILYNCCHTWETTVLPDNGPACFQMVICEVHECSKKDPSFACVAMLREEWKVNGTFACVEGAKKNTGRNKRMTVKGVVLAVMAGLAGFVGSSWI